MNAAEHMFKCLNCGKCCKQFDTGKIKKTSFLNPIKFALNTPYLVLQDWEVDSFKRELLKINSPRQIIPYTLFFDLSDNVAIIDSYTLDEGECPFLKENSCLIYEKRPVVCRAFPFLFDIIDIIFGNKLEIYMPKNIHCTFEKNDTVLNTISGTRMEILKMLETRYGESYSIQISFKLFERSLVDFLMDLERKGTIMLAREGYNEKYLAMRVANAKSVSFSEFYKNLTNMDIRLLFSESWISSYLKDKNENFYMDLANK